MSRFSPLRPAIRIAAIAIVFFMTGAATITESFEDGFGPWSGHGLIYCAPECPFEFEITRSTDHAYQGLWSVEMMGSGDFDSGVVFLRRPIVLQPGTWNVSVGFQVYSPSGGKVGSWDAAAHLALRPPGEEWDFTILGTIAEAGWNEFTHARELTVDSPTTAYISVGYRINFETDGTYWVDQVVIDGVPPQPVPGDLNGDGAVGTADLIILLGAWGPNPGHIADLDGDGAVGLADLIILLGGWGPDA